MNVDFSFCNDDFCKRKRDGKKRDFSRFSTMMKIVIFVLIQIQTKIAKKLIFLRLLDIPI